MGSEALGLGGARWLGALDVAVVPLVAQLAGALAARSRPDPGIERTLRAAVLLLCKALLQARTLATHSCAGAVAVLVLVVSSRECVSLLCCHSA